MAAAAPSRRLLGLVALAVALVLVMGLAIGIGTSAVDFGAVLRLDPFVVSLRLPRVLMGALCGAGLAVAGVAFQALLRNPLADPYIVGVSGGAALGGVLALVLEISFAWALPAFAFAGAMTSVLLLFGIAQARGRADPLTLLLIGVVFNAFAAAVITFIKVIVTPTKVQEILFWLVGVLSAESTPMLAALACYVVAGIAVLAALAGVMNLLSMGDDDAASLGIPVGRARLVCFSAASLLVAAVVAVAGMIGFVGLVIPHIVRRLGGADHRFLVPASALAGAAFLVLADTGARLAFYAWGRDLPVGVITAFAGGPFFLVLLLRR